MKLSHGLIVFDLEATMRTDVRGHTVNDAVLEIGAVAVSRDLQIVGEYSALVIPLVPRGGDEPWRARVGPAEKITGITELEVSERGVEFPKAYAGLQELAEKLGGLKKCRLAAWGNYFDVNMLRRECERWGLAYGFSGTCFDVKTVAWMYQTLAGRRTDEGLTVGKMAARLGVELKGAHRALNDARATAQVLVRCLRDMEGGAFVDVGDGKKLVKLSV
jgi:DNA polymerase-3 subunit alpha (Gram-positive type)